MEPRDPRRARVAFLGDVMLGRGVGEEIARGDREPESFWGDTLEVLRAADLVVANLECAITTSTTRWTRTPKVFHFGAPPAAIDVLGAAGIRLVSLANNHVLDFELRGLLDTVRHLDEAGIAHVGAGADADAARRPAVVEANGLRIGMVAFTDNEPGWKAGPERPGTAFLDIDPREGALAEVERGVAAARGEGADVVVLSLHWGPNMVERPSSRFRAFARLAVECGVDLLHGHSAHVFQGVGLHRGRPILYDAGDFLDDYAIDPVLRNDRSLIFLADVEDGRVAGLEMVPVRLSYAEVNRATGRDLEEVRRRMTALSDELGTRVVAENDVLRVEGVEPSQGGAAGGATGPPA